MLSDIKQTARYLIFSLLCGLLSLQVEATHFKGSEISYSCVGGSTYRIIITEYFDCDGLVVTPSLPSGGLSFLPLSGCTPATPTALGGWTLASNLEVTPLTPSVMGSGTSCSGTPGSSIPGVRQFVFTRDYDFSSVTCPIQLSTEGCCRNGTNLNLVNPGSTGYEIHANLYVPGICNTSPEWLDPGFVYIDYGLPARISMAAYDADGDSLVYSMDTVFSSSGVPVSYVSGYSVMDPLGSGMIPTLDSQTGDLTFPASMQALGSYTVGVSVSEFRNGSLLGQILAGYDFLDDSGANSSRSKPSCFTQWRFRTCSDRRNLYRLIHR